MRVESADAFRVTGKLLQKVGRDGVQQIVIADFGYERQSLECLLRQRAGSHLVIAVAQAIDGGARLHDGFTPGLRQRALQLHPQSVRCRIRRGMLLQLFETRLKCGAVPLGDTGNRTRWLGIRPIGYQPRFEGTRIRGKCRSHWSDRARGKRR